MIDNEGFVFVEPKLATVPVIDDITRRATALWRACKTGEGRYRGSHGCTGKGCAASSDNADHTTPDGRATTSLLVHYVACHRAEVPAQDLAYLAGLAVEDEPIEHELIARRSW